MRPDSGLTVNVPLPALVVLLHSSPVTARQDCTVTPAIGVVPLRTVPVTGTDACTVTVNGPTVAWPPTFVADTPKLNVDVPRSGGVPATAPSAEIVSQLGAPTSAYVGAPVA